MKSDMRTALFPAPNDDQKRHGRDYFQRRVISSGSFSDVGFGDDLWTSGPLDNRMWQWTLHAFMPLDSLFAIERIDEVERLIASWEDRFVEAPIEDDFPWHDHATALRLDRISRHAIETGDARFAGLAARHAATLLREDFYSKHTNHGFDQAVSLVLASVAFPDEEDAGEWRRVGLERLRDEVAIAFTDEGVHIENSPAYHAGMLGNLDRAAIVSEAAGAQEPLFDPDFLEGAVDFLAWVMRPDRFLAYIGDTQSTRATVPEVAKKTRAYQHLLYAQTGGAEGKAPDADARVFETSGYAFYRSRWAPWAGHVHLAVKSGFLSRYHRQDDDLNVLLHAHGEDWLIDSGLYNHNPKDPVRVYMRSAEAHNVPMPSKARASRNAIGKASLAQVAGSENPFCVEAQTSVYPGFKFTRTVTVGQDQRIHLQDRVRAQSDEPVMWLFHVPADKKVSVSDGKARIVGKDKTLMIRVANGKSPPASLHRGFDAAVKSATSTRAGALSASQVVQFGPTTERALRFILAFED